MDKKETVIIDLSFLSLIFFLVFLDTFYFHPIPNIIAMIMLLGFFFRLGLREK